MGRKQEINLFSSLSNTLSLKGIYLAFKKTLNEMDIDNEEDLNGEVI